MSEPIRVVLVDDHPVVRRGLAAMIDAEDDIEVVGEAADGQQAITLTCALNPDVALIDLQMPLMDGVEAIIHIRATAPATQIIILTTFADDDYIYNGLAAGARGYLLKDAPPDQLIEAIRAAHRGESLLDPGVAARLLDRFASFSPQPAPVLPASSAQGPSVPSLPKVAPAATDHLKLTSRELEVLALMVRGARNKEIAETLVIAERTVKIHVGNILGKLGVSNRTEAVALAMKLGLLGEG